MPAPAPSHWQLPDFWKVVALRQIGRLPRAGGVLRLRDLVFDLTPDWIEESIEIWMSSAVEETAQGYTAAELAEHIRSEYSTFTWLLESMLHCTGFEIIESEVRSPVYAAYACRFSGEERGTTTHPQAHERRLR